MYLTHHDDRKGKYQSHRIELSEEFFYNADFDVCSHNPFDVTGYGATKEEALEEFKQSFAYVMAELKAFESMLFDTDVIENDIKEVDCFGNQLS